MNVHLAYLSIIFVGYIVGGEMIATFFWAANELSKTGDIGGHQLATVPGSRKSALMFRLLWPVMGLFFILHHKRKRS